MMIREEVGWGSGAEMEVVRNWKNREGRNRNGN